PSVLTLVYDCAYNQGRGLRMGPRQGRAKPGKARKFTSQMRWSYSRTIFALTIRDRHIGEERALDRGRDEHFGQASGRGLHLAGQAIRLISARPATPRERRQYEEK